MDSIQNEDYAADSGARSPMAFLFSEKPPRSLRRLTTFENDQ